MSLRNKLLLIFSAIFIIPSLLAGSFIYKKTQDIVKDLVFQHVAQLLQERTHEIELSLENVRRVLEAVSQFPPIQGIIRAQETGLDSLDQSTLVQWKMRLQQLFVTKLQTHSNMFQFRYLDEEGNELVRVDSKDGKPYIVPEEELQNKADRSYFQEAMGLPADGYYVSHIELNMDHGQIQEPHVQVFRLAKPIFSQETGERKGVVVINFFAQEWFNNKFTENVQGSFSVFDQDGRFLFHSTDYDNKDIDFLPETELAHFNELGDAYQQLTLYGVGFVDDQKNDEYHLWQKIFYIPNNTNKYWMLMHTIKQDVLFAPLLRILVICIRVALTVFLVILLIIFLSARSITKPLLELTDIAQKISQGNLSITIDKKYKKLGGEIGRLASSFELMTTQLIQSNLLLEKKVAERTKDLKMEQERWRSVLDTAIDAVIIMGVDKKILSINPATERIFGYRKDELIGQNVRILMPEPYKSEHDAYVDQHLKNNHKSILGRRREEVAQRKDGTTFPIEIAVSEFKVGEERFFTGVIMDISSRKKMESDLRYRERALANASNGIIITDPYQEGNPIIYCNETVVKTTGYTVDEILGHNCRFLQGDDREQPEIFTIKKAIENKESCHVVLRNYRKNGEMFWNELRISPVFDEKNKLTHFVGVQNDITARIKMEQALKDSQRRFKTLAEFSPMGIYQTDPNGQCIYVNPAWEKMAGLTEKEALGNGWVNALHPDDRASVFKEWEASLNQHRDFNLIYRFGTKTQVRWVHGQSTAIRNEKGKIASVIGSVLDISELKLKEDELLRSNAELAQFASIASHDLQEPIRKIVGFSQLFENSFDGKIEGKSREYLDYMIDGSKRMQALIQDLLAYSRTGTRELKLEEISVNNILDEIQKDIELMIQENKATIVYGTLPIIQAQASLIKSLFQNLINNAIKYRSSDDPIIEIMAKEENGFWDFSIKDNGLGINMEYAERIFTIFQRLHGKSKYSGTGIGLTLCRRIVERHGGRIWLDEAEEGKGSIFKFTLPIQQKR